MTRTSENKKHWKPCTKWGGGVPWRNWTWKSAFSHTFANFHVSKFWSIEMKRVTWYNIEMLPVSCYSMLHFDGVCILFILYHRYGGVFRCLRSLYELACRQIPCRSWLTERQSMIGESNHLRNERYLGPMKPFLRRWLIGSLGIHCEEKNIRTQNRAKTRLIFSNITKHFRYLNWRYSPTSPK